MTAEGFSLRGDIGIDGKHIAFIGEKPAEFTPDTVIDASSYLVMPALVNAHTHLSMELMRNYKDNAPNLQQWLGEIFPIEDKLNAHDVLIASRLGVIELIQSGITTFNDMYFFPESTARAVNEGGIRGCIGISLFGDLSDTKKRIQERELVMKESMSVSGGRIHLDIAPHAIYTCTKETYQYGHDWAKEHQRRMHTHLSETLKEVTDCLAANHKTPLEYLLEIGVLSDVPSTLAHCVHLTESDVALLKTLDASVVHNPSSNCKLASGVAPIGKYFRAGINVALGTDGSSSNNNLNMFEEMHVASLLSTAFSGDISNLKPYQILEMATINGAKALGLEHQIGTLEVGKEADLLLLDLHKAHLTPLNDPFSALVYSAQASDVHSVFCQGQLVMDNRKVLGFDYDTTLDETNASWKEILKR
ncbi:MAG: amidohydrolase [Sphaerochaeta sp.]